MFCREYRRVRHCLFAFNCTTGIAKHTEFHSFHIGKLPLATIHTFLVTCILLGRGGTLQDALGFLVNGDNYKVVQI